MGWMRESGRRGSMPRRARGERVYGAGQVAASIFTDSTRSVPALGCASRLAEAGGVAVDPVAGVAVAAAAGAIRPLISTWWFTCRRSSLASPSSTYDEPVAFIELDAAPVRGALGGVPAVDPAVPDVPVLAVDAAPAVALASMKRSLLEPAVEPAVVEPEVPVAPPAGSAGFRQPVTVTVS